MSVNYEDRSTDNMDTSHALVTGATGHIGRFVVRALLAEGRVVHALVRDAARRRPEIEADLLRRGLDPARLRLVDGDLGVDGLGLADTRALAAVSEIFHLGASFAWGLTEAEATRTNVLGTERVIALAASLPRRPRVVLVGGYRLAPRVGRDGVVRAPRAEDFAHAGAYEASKFHAHQAALRACAAASVPFTAVHPSSVIGDARTGETTQVTGLGESIVALAEGRLPARAFGPRTFVPVVTADLLARFLVGVASREDTIGREYTLLDPETPLLDALVDRAAATLGVRAPTLRVPTWIVRALPERLTRTSREALGFLDEARYPVDATTAMLEALGLAHPDVGEAFDRWVRYLVSHHARAAAPRAGDAEVAVDLR